jgi:TP901 family phage tail tape measure protein
MVARADLEVVLRATDRATPSVKNLQSTIIRFVGAVSAALAGLSAIAFPVAQAAAFERELRNVQKTTGFVDAEIELLGKDLVALSRGLVVSATELAQIAATAGQLGLGREGRAAVVSFTASVARASIALDLANDAAAKAGARILNIFQLDVSDLENVFATVNELSNTTTANAAQVLDVISRIGPIAGLAFQQVAALGATALDLGVTQEVAGTALVKVFSRIQADAGKFAEALGISIGEFIGQGAEERFRTFLDFLSKQSEVTRAELTRTLAGSGRIFSLVNKFVEDASNNFTQFNRNIETANSSFLEGTSAIEEYENVAGALTSQLQVLKNNFSALTLEIGGQLIDNLKVATRDLIEFLDSEKAREFARVVGQQFSDTVQGVVDFVVGLKDVNFQFQNLLATVKLFVALGIARLVVAIGASFLLAAVQVGKFTLAMQKAALATAVLSKELLVLGVNAVRSLFNLRAVGAVATGVAAVLGGPLGIALAAASALFATLAGIVFQESELFRDIKAFFGFVTEEEAKIVSNETKRLADLAKARKEAASEFRKVVELSQAGQFQVDPSLEVDFSGGIEAFNEASEKAVSNVLVISKGIQAGLTQLEFMAERRRELVDLALRETVHVQRLEAELATAVDLANEKNGAETVITENQRQQFDLAKAQIDSGKLRLAQLSRELDAINELRDAQSKVIGTGADTGLRGQLQQNIEVITNTFSAAEVGAVRLNAQLAEAELRQAALTKEIQELNTQLLEGGDTTGLAQQLVDATAAAEIAEREIASLKEEVAETGDTLSDVSRNRVAAMSKQFKDLGEEDLPVAVKQLEILEKTAGETGSATEDLGKQIVQMAADLVVLEAQKEAIGEIGKAAKDAAKTAKGVFDNTARSVRAFRQQINEARRDMETLLEDRVIDLRIRRRNSEFDKRIEEAEATRLSITEEFQERIDNARTEAERIYLNRRKEDALAAIKTEIEQVESERAFLEEKVLKDRFDRLQARVANFLTAAKAAAKKGNIDEALGLKQAAQDATGSLNEIIGQLTELESTDPFGNISFSVTEDEIRALLGEFQATEKSVSAAIPTINRDLRDATKAAAKSFEDAEAEIDEQLKDLNEEITKLTAEVPNLRQILETISKDLKNSEAFARLQARVERTQAVGVGTTARSLAEAADLDGLAKDVLSVRNAAGNFRKELGASLLATTLRGLDTGFSTVAQAIEEGEKRIAAGEREAERLRQRGQTAQAEAVDRTVKANEDAVAILKKEEIARDKIVKTLDEQGVASFSGAGAAGGENAAQIAQIVLRENRAELNRLTAELVTENREPTPKEQEQIDALNAIIKPLEEQLGELQSLRALTETGSVSGFGGPALPGQQAAAAAAQEEPGKVFGKNAIELMIEENKKNPFKTKLDVSVKNDGSLVDVAFEVLGARRGGFVQSVKTTPTVGIRGARGGHIRGAGTGTSDSIPAYLSNGEYVIDALTTRMMGSNFFAHLQTLARSGRKLKSLPKFATGGLVGGGSLDGLSPVIQAAGVGGAPVHIHLPGGDTMRLREGEDTVDTVKRMMNREARKRGGRLR